ncbi:hypothetical protein FQN53_008061 [Emmonsiellopsis sp. PD_33]|nr:hypothetical protein FQN53_008061 [Emmonsiellopsis sp. PD_33]
MASIKGSARGFIVEYHSARDSGGLRIVWRCLGWMSEGVFCCRLFDAEIKRGELGFMLPNSDDKRTERGIHPASGLGSDIIVGADRVHVPDDLTPPDERHGTADSEEDA